MTTPPPTPDNEAEPIRERPEAQPPDNETQTLEQKLKGSVYYVIILVFIGAVVTVGAVYETLLIPIAERRGEDSVQPKIDKLADEYRTDTEQLNELNDELGIKLANFIRFTAGFDASDYLDYLDLSKMMMNRTSDFQNIGRSRSLDGRFYALKDHDKLEYSRPYLYQLWTERTGEEISSENREALESARRDNINKEDRLFYWRFKDINFETNITGYKNLFPYITVRKLSDKGQDPDTSPDSQRNDVLGSGQGITASGLNLNQLADDRLGYHFIRFMYDRLQLFIGQQARPFEIVKLFKSSGFVYMELKTELIDTVVNGVLYNKFYLHEFVMIVSVQQKNYLIIGTIPSNEAEMVLAPEWEYFAEWIVAIRFKAYP